MHPLIDAIRNKNKIKVLEILNNNNKNHTTKNNEKDKYNRSPLFYAIIMKYNYRIWLEKSSKSIPVLFFSVQPGTMMPEDRDFIRGLGENVTEIEVEGGHMITEDSPDEVGEAIVKWFREKVVVGSGQGNNSNTSSVGNDKKKD